MSTPAEHKVKFFQSIATKLAITFLALAMIPMGGIVAYNVTQGQKEVLKSEMNNLEVLSKSVASATDQLLIENLATASTLAGERLVIDYLATDDEEERAAMQQEIDDLLRNYKDTHPNYDTPGLIDENGIAVWVLDLPQAVGANLSFRDYYRNSIGGTPYVSDVTVGRTSGVSIYMASPVITPEGEIVGISVVRIRSDALNTMIERVARDKNDERIAYVIDGDGVIIAHPNEEMLYKSLGELTPEARQDIASTKRFDTNEGETPDIPDDLSTDLCEKNEESGLWECPIIPESLGIDDLQNKLMAVMEDENTDCQVRESTAAAHTESCAFRYYSPLDGRYHVAGYMRLGSQDWMVVVDLPEEQFLSPLQRLGGIAGISVSIAGVVILIVSLLLAGTITRPVRHLTDAAIAIEHDRPYEPEDIQDVTAGKDETALLGRVFNNMVLALRRRVNELRTVYEIGQDITATLEVDETLGAILHRVHDVIKYDDAEITLYDKKEKKLIVAAWHGASEEEEVTRRTHTYELGEGFSGRIGQETRSLLIEDVQADQEGVKIQTLELADGVPIRSLLGVPLMIRERLVGTLEVASSKVCAFDENDQRLLETIAPQAAIAIEKAQQIHEREQKLKDQIKALKIEIDEARTQEQVSEITDTEYFQNLASRAGDLRKDRQKRRKEEEES